ncbi:deoxyribose-phosphate aldolase [Crocinitomicaceae bacterium]|nr:deoxyribose-phosphate aldolase [Crocinitomicaceae bacterium]
MDNSIIDYTLLDNNASHSDIKELCRKAVELKVKSVCVMPKHVEQAAEALKNTSILVCSVVSFPSGENTTVEKVNEMKSLLSDGADEIDVVWNYKKISDLIYLENELHQLVEIKHKVQTNKGKDTILKIIVESGLLTLNQTKEATLICMKTGVDFIKTSTGKVQMGAEIEKVKLMRQTISESTLKIKASGGIRTIEQFQTFQPYVDRFGMGYASVDEMNGLESNSGLTY